MITERVIQSAADTLVSVHGGAKLTSDGVATKLDARQALEAIIRKATQATAQGQAEGRFLIRNGQRHPINQRHTTNISYIVELI
eukprot:scaffold22459_cov54-Attheya_sp.AAC.8